MIRTIIPATLGLIAIVGLSLYENIKIKDRWGEPTIKAEQLAERFSNVPMEIGDWVGQDMPVDEVTRKTAGAVGYVSRVYKNPVTEQYVELWLIVGHSRDITRHTPDICRVSQGYRPVSTQLRHPVKLDNGETAEFFTAKYEKEDEIDRYIDRVFWTFNHPEKNKWEAPAGTQGPRWHYGLSRALYKLYFTSRVDHDEQTIQDSVALEFAELMLPAIDAALFPKGEMASEAETTEADAEVSEATETE